MESPGGATLGYPCVAPPGLGSKRLRLPTAPAVGYILSPLAGLSGTGSACFCVKAFCDHSETWNCIHSSQHRIQMRLNVNT
jgi:hypothetical protein